jgi:hypothetical protein
MPGPTRNCTDLENLVRNLQQRIAVLQRTLDEEPDLSGGTIAYAHQQIYEAHLELAIARSNLLNCLSEFTIAGIETTQCTQYFSINGQGSGRGDDNSVPLVAGRSTIFRVYVDSKSAGPLTTPVLGNVTGLLSVDRIYGDGSIHRVADLRPINASIPARSAESIDRRRADHTLNFRLPAYECRGVLRYSVVVFGQNPVNQRTFAEDGGSAGLETISSPTSPAVDGQLTFSATAPLQIRLVRIRYRNAARGFDLAAPTRTDFWGAAKTVLRTFPVPYIYLVRDSIEFYDGDFTNFFASGGPGARGTTGTVFEILSRLRSTEGLPTDVIFLALIPGYPANLTGAAGWAISGRAISEVDGFVLAQELGHTSGFPEHAPCGGPNNPDLHYPPYRTDIEASIGEVGYDVETSALFDPGTCHDFMSYCYPKWISPYTYGRLLNHFHSLATTQVRPTVLEHAAVDVVNVAFSVRDGRVGNVRVSPAVIGGIISQAGSQPITVRTYDGAEQVIDIVTVHQDAPYGNGPSAVVHLSGDVPLREESRKLRIVNGGDILWELDVPAPLEVVDSIRVSNAAVDGNEDMLAVTSTLFGAGDETRLDYSCDGGSTWQTVVAEPTSESTLVDTNDLSGGDDCCFRVVVMNGCRSSSILSERFQIRVKPKLAAVVSPSTGSVVRRGQTVLLLGDIVTLGRSGKPMDMNWSSSIDGYLGSGREILIHTLSSGRHRITLAAEDGLGGETQDDVFLYVIEEDES